MGVSYTVHAQVVAAPGSGAQVIQTQNGLQQVNIARPNGSGVSLNTYSQFNVPNQGTILNNATAITQTQQAGYVNGNPNLLPGGSARVIVNQVTSTSPSTLQGYLEVAGPRAEVVIANPNGILVNGGGFINTSRATLTTGAPVFGGSGSLDAYRVTGGQISIQGAGLNASNVDQVDLIARAVQANAAVYANQLNVIAGANQVDRNTLATTPIAGTGPAPALGIDVSQLGGMYANKIFLASTENGVGVSLRGVTAAQAGDLTLTSQGQLILAGTTSATGNLSVKVRGDITNSGSTYGSGAVSVSSDGTLTNSGALAAQQGLTVSAGALNSTGSLGAGVAQSGAVTQVADLNVVTTGALSANGTNVAGGNAMFQGAGVSLAHSQTSANGSLALTSTGNADLTGATTHAGSSINANVTGAFVNDAGRLTGGGSVQINAGSVSNTGGQLMSQAALGVQSAGTVGNAQGTLQAGGALSVSGSTIDNTAGRLISLNADGLTLVAGTSITNAAGTTADGAQGGVIGGNGVVGITTGALVNHGQINAATNATLKASTLDNSNGGVTAGNALTAQIAGAVSNQQGALLANTTAVSAASLDNTSGKIEGSQLAIATAGDLVNRSGAINQTGQTDTALKVGGTLDNTNGSIAANAQNLSINAQAVTNDGGKLLHSGTGALNVNSQGPLSNVAGQIRTNGALLTSAGTVNNTSGSITAQGAQTLTAVGAVNNTNGTVHAGDALKLQAGGALTNVGGNIEANNAHSTLNVSAASLDNTSGRVVNVGDGATSVSVQQTLLNANPTNVAGQGLIGGNGALSVTAGALQNHGTLSAKGDQTLTAQSFDNSNGNATASGALTANIAGALRNQQGALSANSTTVTAGSLDNTTGKIEGNQLSLTTTGDLINRGGSINQYSQADTTLKVGGTLDDTNGAIAANAQNLTINAQAITNDSGKLLHAGTGIFALNSQGALSNVAGQVQTNGALLASANTLDNTNGSVRAGDALKMQAGGVLTNVGGNVEVNNAHGTLSVSAASLDNTSGRVVNVGDGATTVAVQQTLLNANPGNVAGRGMIGGNGTLGVTVGTLNNHGAISAKGDQTLSAESFDNSNGSVTAGGALTANIAGALNSQHGTLSAGSTTLTVGSLDNTSGKIEGNQLGITTAGDLVNRGGSINQYSQADTTLKVGGRLDDTNGAISANAQNLTVNAQAITNDGGKLLHSGAGALNVNSQGALSNVAGQIRTNGTLLTNAGSLDNASGSITAQGAQTLTVAGALNNTSGTVRAGDALKVQAGGVLTNVGGNIEANGAHGALSVSAASLDNTSGRVVNVGDGATTVSVQQTLLNANPTNATGQGLIGGNGALGITAGSLQNHGTLSAKGDQTLTAQSFDNSSGSAIAGGTLTANVAGALTSQHGVLSADTTTINAASLDNTSGKIEGNQLNLTTTGDLVNRGGSINQYSETDTTLKVGGALDDTNGSIAANAQNLTVNAQAINNNGGKLSHAGAGTLTLNSQGALSNVAGQAQTNGALLANVGALDNTSGTVRAGDALKVQAGGALTNVGGNIEANGAHSTLNVSAVSLDNTSGRVVNVGDGATTVSVQQTLLNVNPTNAVGQGLIGGNGALGITAGTLQNHGAFSAKGAQTLTAQSLDNSNGSVTAGGALTANIAGALSNQHGTLSASSTALTVGSLDNTAGKIEGNQLGVTTTGDLINRGGTINQYSQADTTLKVGGALDSTNGLIAANANNLSINAQVITNDGGKLQHAGAGTFTLDSQGALSNVAGQAQTNGALLVQGSSLDNTNGFIAAQGTETITTPGALNNTNGTLHAGGNAQVQAGGVLTNVGGNIEANGAHGTLTVSAVSLDNTSGRVVNVGDGVTTVAVQQTLLNANPNGVTGRGLIGGNGSLGVTAGTLSNHGAISAKGDATLVAQSFDNSNGSTTASGGLTATVAGALTNQLGLLSGNATNVSADSLNNTSGQIEGNQLGLTTTGDLLNRGGVIQQFGQADSTLKAGGTLDNTGGSIAANANNLTLSGQTIANDNGKLLHAGTGTLSLTAQSALTNTNHGQIQTNGALVAKANSLNNTLGGVSALGAASLTTTNDLVNKQGTVFGQTGLTLASGGQIDNTNGSAQTSGNLSATASGVVTNASGVISANGAHGVATVSGASLNNAAGRLVNAGDGATTITATTSINNAGGALGGNGDVTLGTQTLTNTTNGSVAAGGALALNTTNAVNNRGGLIYGGQGLTLNQTGATLTNDGGSLQGGKDATISVASMTNAGGNVRVNRDVSVQGVVSGDGEMTAGRNLSLNVVGNYTNGANNRLRADGNMTVSASGTFTNSGVLGAAGNTTVQGANVVNVAGGDITGSTTTVSTSGTISNAGRIEGNAVQTNSTALVNTGTIIGNAVQVQAGDITNSGAAALMAAVQSLNIYATNSVSNLDGATLYSAGSLQIARDGTRDPASGLLANQVGTLTNRSATIDADGDIDIAARTVYNTRTSIVTAPGTPQTTSQTLVTWYAGLSGSDLNSHRSLTIPSWSWDGQGSPISASQTNALAQPITITVDKSTVTNLNAANQTLSFSTAPTERYINPPEFNQCGREDPQCRQDATHTRNLTTNATQWYQSIQDNGSTYSITFWPDWDPNKNLRPDQVRVRLDLGVDSRDYNETQRTTVTTRATDQLISASDPAKIRASGSIRINSNGGSILNQSSTMAAGGNLVRTAIGGAVTDQGTVLQQSVTTTEQSTFYWHQKTGGEQDTQVVPYPTTPVGSTTVTALPAIATSNQAVQTTAQTINVTTVNRLGQTVTGSGVTGGGAAGAAVGSAGTGATSVGAMTGSSGSTVGSAGNGAANAGAMTGSSGSTVGSAGSGAANAGAMTGGTGSTVGSAGSGAANAGAVTGSAGSAVGSAGSGTANAGTVAGNSGSAVGSAGSGTASSGALSGTATSTVGATTGNAHAPQTLGTPTGGIPNLTLPINGLFHIQPAPSATYLVATDSRFTQYTQFISSDYMLSALNLNPQQTQKRLGDGFYEEKLVRDQITQLTGRVFLAGYTNQLDEYRGLMDAGVKYAKSFNLTPGIGLSDAQMAQLTTDMVWLVSQDVTLPDGSHQTVLVPKLYLAQANAVDLNSTGALVAGKTVSLNASGDVSNSGHIVGDVATQVLGDNIVNQGTIGGAGSTTAVQAVQDVRNIGGTITGQNVGVIAGRDVINATQTISNLQTIGPNNYSAGATGVGSVGTISATNNATVAAGRDLTMQAGAVTAGNTATLVAGRDLTLGTVQLGTTQDTVSRGGQSYSHDLTVSNLGSTVSAGQNVVAVAGRDVTLTSSTVQAGNNATVVAGRNVTETAALDSHTHSEGSLGGSSQYTKSSYDEKASGSAIQAGNSATLGAGQTQVVNQVLQANGITMVSDQGPGNVSVLGSSISTGNGVAKLVGTGDVTVGAVTESHKSDFWLENKSSGFMSSEQNTKIQNTRSTNAVGSSISGDSVTAVAGRDLTVQGSTVAGTNDVNLQAGNNLTITTAQNTSSSHSYEETTKSGFGATGSGLSYGNRNQKDTINDNAVTQTSSMVGSTGGNVNLTAGNALKVTGSQVIAAKDLTGTGADVTIDAAQGATHHDETHEVKQSGFTLGVSGGVIGAATGAVQKVENAGQSKDGRAAALWGIASARDAFDAGSALTGPGGATAGAAATLSWGTSQSKQTSTDDATQHTGSTVTAGGKASLTATGVDANGNKTAGDINIAGSDVNAKQVALKAAHDVNIVSATDTDESHSRNESSSASVGVSYGFGQNSAGFGVSASASKSKGNSDSSSATQVNSHVNGSESVSIASGNDTNVQGGVVSGGKVSMDVGGNLNLASRQDTAQMSAKQESMGGGFSISQGGGSANFSASKGHADGNYANVTEQSGIRAGDGGFDINVKGNTDLKGAVIASTAAPDKNQLTTGTLTWSDTKNHSEYSADSVGVSAGFTAGSGNSKPSSGQTSGKNTGGISPMIPQSDSGSQDGVAQAAVSQGAITITNKDAQKQDVATLNRDTTKTNTTVGKNPDLNEVLGKQADMMAAAQAAGEAVAKTVGDVADKKQKEAQARLNAANDAYKQNPSDANKAAIAAAETDVANWKEGGDYRAALHMAGGAVIAGLGGGNALAGAVGAGVSSKLAPQLQDLSKSVAGSVNTGSTDLNDAIGNLAANIAAGGVGFAVGGGAGAATAANTDRFNRQLHQEEAKSLAALKKGKSPAEQDRLDAAACYLVHCADGVPASDANYARLQAMQTQGAQYTKEIQTIQATGQFIPYSSWDRITDVYTSLPAIKGAANVVGGVFGTAGGVALTAGAIAGCPTTAVTCAGIPVGAGVTGLGLNQFNTGTGQITGSIPSTEGQAVLNSFNPNAPGRPNPLVTDALTTGAGIAVGVAGGKVLGALASDGTAVTQPTGSTNRNFLGGGATLADDAQFALGERQLKPGQGTLSGSPEAPPANASKDQVRSINRQNEAAQILADHGLDVNQLPNTGKPGPNPDLSINGQVADVYAPKSGNLQTIRDKVVEKTAEQAPNVVINLADSPLSASEVAQYLQRNPVGKANSVIIIKDGRVTVLGG